MLKYFLYVCFSPRGRINRAGWWLYWGLFLLCLIADSFLSLLWGIGGLYTRGIGIYENIYSVFLVYSLIVVSIKRFHDTNRSEWYVLVWLVPVYGWFYVPIVCGFFKGTDGENKYGDPIDRKSFAEADK